MQIAGGLSSESVVVLLYERLADLMRILTARL